ncbi:MAG: hypothetical protein WKF76_10535 [Nocardioidaceae bacterium]
MDEQRLVGVGDDVEDRGGRSPAVGASERVGRELQADAAGLQALLELGEVGLDEGDGRPGTERDGEFGDVSVIGGEEVRSAGQLLDAEGARQRCGGEHGAAALLDLSSALRVVGGGVDVVRGLGGGVQPPSAQVGRVVALAQSLDQPRPPQVLVHIDRQATPFANISS